MGGNIDTARLQASQLGSDLDDRQRARLAERLEFIPLRAGEVLVREGDRDPRLFLLAAGSLEVLAQRGEAPEVMYRMRAGECAGTRAFIDRAERRATLRAATDSEVYALDPDEFEGMIESDPWIVYRIMRAIFRITHRNLLRMNEQASELENYVMKVHGRY